MKTKPMAHQAREHEQHLGSPYRGLWWEPGTGKTKSVIDLFCALALAGEVDGMLVLAPGGVHRAWVDDEIPAHAWDEVAPRIRSLAWRSDRRHTAVHKEAARRLLAAGDGLPVLAMTYDAFRTDDAAKFAKEFLTKRKTLYVADETTRVASPAAKTTKRLLASAGLARYRRALNGTPVADSPFKAYSQVRFVDPQAWSALGIRNFTDFKGYFGEYEKSYGAGGRSFPKLVRYRNLEHLSRVLAAVGSRVTKDEALDLPPKTYVRRHFDLSREQRSAYDALVQEMRTSVGDSELTVNGALALLTRLQQCTGGWLPTDDGHPPQEVGGDRPRVAALLETLEEFGVPDQQAIVWCRFTAEVNEVMRTLKAAKIRCARYDGEVGTEDRERVKAEFQRGDARVLVAKQQCAGVGLTLHAASVVVYYSNLFSLDLRQQSEDRAHRKGQVRPVTYVDLVAADTVDLRVLDVLTTKRSTSAAVTDKSWWSGVLSG